MNKLIIALTAVRLLTGVFVAGVAQADELRPPTEAAIDQCVKITMSVKGCGDDALAPCESSFCYKTYDFKLSDLDRQAISTESHSGPSNGNNKKLHRHRHRAA